MSDDSKVTASIDLAAEGKHYGRLSIPHSRNESGWGAVHLPVVSVRNGAGATVLLTGGNHGDEYEGPISLMKLARSLVAESVTGGVIVIPALNFPAVMAGTRVSPVDGINMNRAFPGARNGSVSQMIAHFVQAKILPACDAVFDIHSGGKSMMFAPFVAYHRLGDADLTQRTRAAAMATGAPTCLELVELDADGMLDTTVEEMGKVFISSEFGGAGTTSPATIAITEIAVRNFLVHMGIIDEPAATHPVREMHMPDPGCYLIADEAGLYEDLVGLDAEINEGDPVGQIHFPGRPERAPTVYRAGTSGTIIGKTHKVLTEPGDFLALIAHEAQRDA